MAVRNNLLISFPLPHCVLKGVGRKFSRRGEGGHEKKNEKIAKKTKNSTVKPLPPGEEQRKKGPKQQKKTENSTIKPLSTISVPCMKIQWRPRPPLAPRCRRPCMVFNFLQLRSMLSIADNVCNYCM